MRRIVDKLALDAAVAKAERAALVEVRKLGRAHEFQIGPLTDVAQKLCAADDALAAFHKEHTK